MGPLTPYVMILADYAHNPLILRPLSSKRLIGSYPVLGNVVTGQTYLRLDAAVAIKDRLLIGIDVPVALQSGTAYNTDIGVFTQPAPMAFGDIRLAARVRLWGEDLDPFQIAVGGYSGSPPGARARGRT